MVSSHERGGVFAASGFGTVWKGARAELSLQSELLNRQDLSGVDADFQRHRITPKFEQRWDFPVVELAAIGSGSVFVQDAFGLNETYGLWEAELSATTPKIWGQGVRASARRYSQAPRAEEIFGDGALLLPSQELKPRDGLYVAAGPGLEREHWSLGTELFYDRSRNEPLFVSSNPGAARALNLGGSVASGVHAQSGVTYTRVQWTGEYEFRHAVNDTDIDWQRGQPIPGVPAHKAGSTLTFTWLPFSWGGTYTYVSRRAIDLVGQWWQGDQHQLGVFVERRAQTWVARAEGNQLLPVKEAPELNSGAAGPTLLNQGVRGWEARIIVEFLL
jgi:hypothetical protein